MFLKTTAIAPWNSDFCNFRKRPLLVDDLLLVGDVTIPSDDPISPSFVGCFINARALIEWECGLVWGNFQFTNYSKHVSPPEPSRMHTLVATPWLVAINLALSEGVCWQSLTTQLVSLVRIVSTMPWRGKGVKWEHQHRLSILTHDSNEVINV